MGILTQIKNKSKTQDSPSLVIDKPNQQKILSGEVVIVKDDKTGESYIVRIDSENVGKGQLDVNDLIIDKVKIPAAAKN